MTTALPNSRAAALLGGLLLVASQVAGCARSRSADDDVDRAMDFGRQRALASCEASAGCGCPGSNESIRCRLSFEDADVLRAELISALEDERVTFDPDAARRCLTATSETCSAAADLAGFASPGVCRSVYAGTVPAGSECTIEDPVQADRGEDERCGTWFEDGQLHQATCSAMLRCDAGTCVPKLALGTQCSADSDCACGATCVFGSSGGCTAVAIRTQAGDSCGVLPELVAECDAERLACADGVCRPKGDGSSGSVCDQHQGFGACDDGLGCSSGTCTPPR